MTKRTIELSVLPYEGKIGRKQALRFLTTEVLHYVAFSSQAVDKDTPWPIACAYGGLQHEVAEMTAACAAVLSGKVKLFAKQCFETEVSGSRDLAYVATTTCSRHWCESHAKTAEALERHLARKMSDLGEEREELDRRLTNVIRDSILAERQAGEEATH